MFNLYYYNANKDDKGRHEVHESGCYHLPSEANRQYLGMFVSCEKALTHAKAYNPGKSFDGCYYCCRECHKG